MDNHNVCDGCRWAYIAQSTADSRLSLVCCIHPSNHSYLPIDMAMRAMELNFCAEKEEMITETGPLICTGEPKPKPDYEGWKHWRYPPLIPTPAEKQ